jgi:hypothetical protein
MKVSEDHLRIVPLPIVQESVAQPAHWTVEPNLIGDSNDRSVSVDKLHLQIYHSCNGTIVK